MSLVYIRKMSLEEELLRGKELRSVHLRKMRRIAESRWFWRVGICVYKWKIYPLAPLESSLFLLSSLLYTLLFPLSLSLSHTFVLWIRRHGMATPNGSDDGNHRSTTPSESALIFLGTGCSSMVPNVMCLIQPSNPPCPVCVQSLSLPPDQNPNYRSWSLVLPLTTEEMCFEIHGLILCAECLL